MSQSLKSSLPFSHQARHWLRANSRLAVGAAALTAALVVGCGPQAAQQTSQASFEAQLAEHLRETGATMYGAYWCPHCADQKALFAEASDQIPYVECDPSGQDPQPQLCQERGIQGYPTWEIDGQLHPGTRSLDELARLSDFQSPQSP
jgi:glutaredoxin